MSVPQTKILLVDDHPIVRSGLQSLFELADAFRVVGEANNGIEAVAKAAALEPDIVLMDINMPEMDGLTATPKIREACPRANVVILSMENSSQYVKRALSVGARGYLLKSTPFEEMEAALSAIRTGNLCFSPGIAHIVTEKVHDPIDYKNGLSDRETLVLQGIARGLVNKQIAHELGLSLRTIETYRKNLKRKLGLSTTAELTRFALASALL